MLSRLKHLRAILGLTQREFAETIGIRQSSYSMIEQGQRGMADRYVKSICLAFDVNENWLRTGEGPIFANAQLRRELLELFDELTPNSQKYALELLRGLYKVDNEKKQESK